MSNPTTITGLLQQTLVGSTETIKQAEKALETLHYDPNFINNLLLISTQSSIPYNIQKAAVIYTLRVARDYIQKKQYENMQKLANLIVRYMSENSIEITLMKLLSATVQFILSRDRDYKIKRVFQAKYLQMLTASRGQPDANINFEILGLCAQMILGSTVHITKQSNQFIRNSLLYFVQLNLRMNAHIPSAIQSNDRAKIIGIFRSIKIYSYAFKLYLKKIYYSQMNTVKLLYEQSICKLIAESFQFSLGNNQLSKSIIFYQQNQDNDLVQLLHSVKADYITGLTLLCRTLIQNFKDPKMLEAHALLKEKQLFPTMVYSVAELFTKCPYHRVKSRTTVKIIEQIYYLLISALSSNFFYETFLKQKKIILHGCIFKTLQFSPADYQTYSIQPNEFIGEVLQIVDMDTLQYQKKKKTESAFDAQGYEQIQNYHTLRNISALLLNAYCKNIDGTFPQIFDYALKILQGPVQETASQLRRTLLLCLLGILKSLAEQRKDVIEKATIALIKVIRGMQIPKFFSADQMEEAGQQQKQKNLVYFMLMIVLYKYIPKTKDIQQKVLPQLSQIVSVILADENCPDALKFISYDLIVVLVNQDQTYNLGVHYTKMMNQLLIKSYKYADDTLETMYYLYKYKDSQIAKHPDLVVGTVQNLSQIIYKQAANPECEKLNINKAWNVLSDICENETFIPTYIPQIEQAVIPFLQFIDGKKQLDYQQNIFLMMTSFIRKTKTVTQNQLNMFEIIPKLFYTQYHHSFVHSFETLQVFILYGSNILNSAPQAINTIIDMCIASMNTISFKVSPKQEKKHSEGDNCEGVLLLHSLILSCGNSFSQEMWVKMAKAFTNRYENPPLKDNVLKSSLLSGIGLIVMIGHKFFSHEDSDIMLNQILQNYGCFTQKYPAKVMTVVITQLLPQCNLPFVQNRFTFLLDCVLSLLESANNDQFFDLNRKSQTKRDYDIIISMVTNMIVDLDQIQYFKNKIKVLKQSYPQMIQQSFSELPEQRKDYFRNIMSVAKVVGEQRKIFKISKS